MKLEYKCQLSDKVITITLNEGDKCITTEQALQNQKAIKEIFRDKPNAKTLKDENFKLGQTLICYQKIKQFISKYFPNTKLTKQMLCFIIGKGVKHNLGNYHGYRKLWHSQIASIVGCHYNTPKNMKHLIEQLCKDDKRTYQSGGYDFISHVVTKISKSCKERTVRTLFKAGPKEGLTGSRIKSEDYCESLHEIDGVPDDNQFGTKIINY